MLNFFSSQSVHDTCESYCPEFLYDYFKSKGFWDHLFQQGFCEQLTNNELMQSACEFAQEHPYTSVIATAAVLLSTGTGAVIGLKNLSDKRAEQKARDEITIVRNDTVDLRDSVAEIARDIQSSDKSASSMDDTLSTPVVISTPKLNNPKKMPVSTILGKVFDYLKARQEEDHSDLAEALDISEENVTQFKQLPGFPKVKSQFMGVVANGSTAGAALKSLGLPENGSYPVDDTHYQKLARTIGMPSAEDDKGHRIKVF